MGKVLGILLFVIAIWFGIRAFEGGSVFTMPERDPNAQRPAERVGQRVQGALDASTERTEKMMPD